MRALMVLAGFFYIMFIGFDTFIVCCIFIGVFVGSLLLYNSYKKEKRMANTENTDVIIEFYKNKETDKIWWVDYIGMKGRFAVSFDKKKILNLFSDYPHNFTQEEKQLFDKENPYWANYFKEEEATKNFIEGKTIFDFTSDKKVINHFVNMLDLKDEKELKDFLDEAGIKANTNCLIELAHLTKNKELLDAVIKYKDDRDQRICDEMVRTNCIID
jgi:hypothetical protein